MKFIIFTLLLTTALLQGCNRVVVDPAGPGKVVINKGNHGHSHVKARRGHCHYHKRFRKRHCH